MTNDERQLLLKLRESFLSLADSQLETRRIAFAMRDALISHFPELDATFKSLHTESLMATTASLELNRLRRELEGFLKD
jgi:hypothetical protein